MTTKKLHWKLSDDTCLRFFVDAIRSSPTDHVTLEKIRDAYDLDTSNENYVSNVLSRMDLYERFNTLVPDFQVVMKLRQERIRQRTHRAGTMRAVSIEQYAISLEEVRAVANGIDPDSVTARRRSRLLCTAGVDCEKLAVRGSYCKEHADEIYQAPAPKDDSKKRERSLQKVDRLSQEVRALHGN